MMMMIWCKVFEYLFILNNNGYSFAEKIFYANNNKRKKTIHKRNRINFLKKSERSVERKTHKYLGILDAGITEQADLKEQIKK